MPPRRTSPSPTRGRGNERGPPPPPLSDASPSPPPRLARAGREPSPPPPGGWWFAQPDVQPPDDAFPAEFRDLDPRLEERLQAALDAGHPPGSLSPYKRSNSPPARGRSPSLPRTPWNGGVGHRTRYGYSYDTVEQLAQGRYRWRGMDLDEMGLRALEDRWERDYALVPDQLKEPENYRGKVTGDEGTKAMVFADLLIDPDLAHLQLQVPAALQAPPLSLRVDRYGNVVSNNCDHWALCSFEVDHIFPHARCGRSEPGNLQCLFWMSNGTKSGALHNSFVRRASDGVLLARRRVQPRGRGTARGRGAASAAPSSSSYTVTEHPLQNGITPAFLGELWEARLQGHVTHTAAEAAERDARYIDLLGLLLKRNWLKMAGVQPAVASMRALLDNGAISLLHQFMAGVGNMASVYSTAQAVVRAHASPDGRVGPLPPPPPLPEDPDGAASDEDEADEEEGDGPRADATPPHDPRPHIVHFDIPVAPPQPTPPGRPPLRPFSPLTPPSVPPEAYGPTDRHWHYPTQPQLPGAPPVPTPGGRNLLPPLPHRPEQMFPTGAYGPPGVWRKPLNPMQPLPPTWVPRRTWVMHDMVAVHPLPPWDPSARHPENWCVVGPPPRPWWRRMLDCGSGFGAKDPPVVEVRDGQFRPVVSVVELGAGPVRGRAGRSPEWG